MLHIRFACLILLGIGLTSISCSGLYGQCPTTNVTGNLTPSNGDTLSGTYNITGDFIIPAGVTVFVRPFSSSGCGRLEVFANGNIQVAGTIRADSAGFSGGTSGLAGLANNVQFITSCPSPTGQCGDVFTFGGSGGGNGNPGGGGSGGSPGLDGSGRKNQCLTFGDEGGRVGGAGGAGGGAGGSYGGGGTAGQPGGVGTTPVINSASTTNCTNNPIGFGFGGNGGILGSAYGTATGPDIDPGSAGGGAGGGGRGRFAGQNGGAGGAGGGMVRLVAGGNLSFSGLISANGSNGGKGGDGGDAGSSPQCCSDGCNGADEYTHTGAGGGGSGGGGGAGGGVFLQGAGVTSVTGNINVRGGNGGQSGQGGAAYSNSYSCLFGNSNVSCTNATSGGLGGAGGGGRIKVFYNDCAPGNVLSLSSDASAGNGSGGFGTPGTIHVGPDNSFVLGTASPSNQTVCYGGDPGNMNSLPAQGGFGGISYQWQEQPNCSGPWSNVAGGTVLNYDPPSGLLNTTCYRMLISSGTCIGVSDTLQVDVIPPLPAAVSPVGAVDTCLGDSIQLTTSGGSGATYQWAFNGSPILNATDSFYTAFTTGDYSVTITYPVGCDAVSAPTSITFEPPPPAFAAVLGDSTLCPGDSVELFAFGGGTYQWYYNGSLLPNDTLAGLSGLQPGYYHALITSAGGCTNVSDSVQLIAVPDPSPAITTQGPLQFCEGDSVNLTASGTGGDQLQWLLNGAPLPQDSTVITVGDGGNYQLIFTTQFGCTDTSLVQSIQVDPSPNADLQPAGIPVSCQGDSALFLSTGNGTFNWLFNGTPIPDTTSFLYTSIPGNYSVVVTSPLGCVDTSVAFSYAWFPPSTLTINGPNPAFACPGQSIDLQAQIVGNANTVQWYRNDSLLTGETGFTISTETPGIYSFEATDPNGCIYSSAGFTVTPGLSPNASIDPLGANPFCPGESLVLLGEGGNTYQWLLDGQVIQGATDSFLNVTTSGTYSLAIQTGCGEDTVDFQVTAAPGPVAGFIYDNLPGNEVNFIDQSISGATWQWDFGDGSPLSNLQNPNHQYPVGGEYFVTMITQDIFGCADTISLTILAEDPGVFIPNVFSPNGDGINDLALTRFDELLTFDFWIFDRWGRLVYTTNLEGAYWDGNFRGKAAPEGVYFYVLKGLNAQNEPVTEKGNLHLVR